MALAAVRTAMPFENKKDIHPFFSRTQKEPSPEPISAPPAAHEDDTLDDPDFEQPGKGKAGRKKRARRAEGPKSKEDRKLGAKGQPSLENFTGRSNGATEDATIPAGTANQLENAKEQTLEEDPNPRRSKRRKTTSPAPIPAVPIVEVESLNHRPKLEWFGELQAEAHKDTVQDVHMGDVAPVDQPVDDGLPTAESRGDDPQNDISEPVPESANSVPMASTATSGQPFQDHEPEGNTIKSITPKKRVLRVSKTGKLISPSPSKPKPEPEISTTPKKKRGRKPKAKASLTVTIKYGSDADSRRLVGQTIEDILSGGVVTAARPTSPKKAPPPKPAGPPKPAHPFFTGKVVKTEEVNTHPFFTGKAAKKEEVNTHPFFTGKAAKKDEVKPTEPTADASALLPSTTAKKTAVTPGKLRAESRSYQPTQPMPAFGSAFGSSRITKPLGTIEAPWPTRDSAHVRNIFEGELPDLSSSLPSDCNPLKPRKFKRAAITVPPNEDLICNLANELNPIISTKSEDTNAWPAPTGAVRLPTRLLTTGVDIQERVRKETCSAYGGKKIVHPAVTAIFNEIEHNLTPFDKGKCESQAWVQKYAPTSAAHVLQAGKEALVLRDWLQNLTVMAVQSSKVEGSGSTLPDPKRPAKKRRKVAEDDFIVSDEDVEDDELVEMSDGDDYGQAGCKTRRPRSQKCSRMTRNKNVIILSGPHGCGKSAAVYAVAKELGFEVFEINSSSRRSGKDIHDKVGDMSENHLVNHRRPEAKAPQDILPAEETEEDHMDEALEKDIESGRQGTVTSFFQSKPTKTAKRGPKPKAKDVEKPKPVAQATISLPQKPRRDQKQSLILFEEADVLFEEDQQFWSQVTKLASLSKRPVVITCNDENLIPWNLPLAAILRLAPPPTALATDYMLTLAAKEGHILKRTAVCDLFESRKHDLRASITELNLWCQMSVGDRKGGLDWIFQRWPPGKDVDEKGRTLRVASEDTYQSGMGLASYDMLKGTSNVGFDKEEALLQNVWRDWGIGPDAWNRPDELTDQPSPHHTNSPSRIEELKRMDGMLDAVSSADVYCRVGLPTYEHFYKEPTDPSLPSIPEKERLNYTVDAPVLQVDVMSDFSSFDTDMAVRSRLSIQRAFRDSVLLEHDELPSTPAPKDRITELILQDNQNEGKQEPLSRPDFSNAFDLLASPPDTSAALGSSYPLLVSTFDRPFKIITEDLAPYVRSIVAYEQRLEAQRLRISNLISEGGRSKRPRTTRASRVAQEGGTRQSKRRERWFDKDLNYVSVMATAGQSWSGLGSLTADETEASSRTGDSLPGTQEE